MNCILCCNTSVFGDPNYDSSVSLNYCCTTPLPPGGIGNIADEPQLVSLAGGDFHLQTIRSNIVGRTGETTVTDVNAPGAGLLFYRVGVQ